MSQAARLHSAAGLARPIVEPDLAPPQYEGLITRAIAFAIDCAIIDAAGLLVGVGVGLALSVLAVGDDVKVVLLACGGVAFVIWSVTYFVVFWSTTGQTPGNRLMRIRVCRASDGGVLRPRHAVVRFGALMLAALPLFAGFLTVLVDDRRRGVHDMLARTVVVGVPEDRPDY
jgi:uncharacterized RDD family membrane protein YckC